MRLALLALIISFAPPVVGCKCAYRPVMPCASLTSANHVAFLGKVIDVHPPLEQGFRDILLDLIRRYPELKNQQPSSANLTRQQEELAEFRSLATLTKALWRGKLSPAQWKQLEDARSVRAIEDVFGGNGLARRFRFQVEEPFTEGLPSEIEVFSGIGGGDCGSDFPLGGRYLVWLARQEGSPWTTSICSGNDLAGNAAGTLELLRAEKAGRQLSRRVLGRLVAGGEGVDSAGRQLRLIANGQAYEVTTRRDGMFAFVDLPAAVYRLEIRDPGWVFDRFIFRRTSSISQRRVVSRSVPSSSVRPATEPT